MQILLLRLRLSTLYVEFNVFKTRPQSESLCFMAN